MERLNDPEIIPLFEERARIEKTVVETSHDILKIETRDYAESLTDELLSEACIVERRPVGRFVDVAPEVRIEGESTIYPVIEEVMVKRLLLREEVTVTRKRTLTPYSETVVLRRQQATVARGDSERSE